jgi:hypothetical protein
LSLCSSRTLSLVPLVFCGLLACTDPTDSDDDDDGFSIDDDDVTVDFTNCVGEPQAIAEVEPNSDTPQAISASGDLVISGTCSTSANDGANWTGDVDAFALSYACGGNATFSLAWDSGQEQDTDARLSASSIDPNGFLWHGFTPSTNPGESGAAFAGGEMLLEILCWGGPENSSWTFTFDWATSPDWTPPGDDDDSAGVDDDSAGDDDDSAGDDDDSAGDDDDSAGDDDDSAGDDDDSAGDDDDSAL